MEQVTVCGKSTNGLVALQHLKINRLSSFLLQTSKYMTFPKGLQSTPCKQCRVSIFRANLRLIRYPVVFLNTDALNDILLQNLVA